MTKEQKKEFLQYLENLKLIQADDFYREGLDMAISALKGGWIPIEEREPDNVHERVYVTQLVPKSPCKPNGTTVYITRFIDLHEKKKYITAWQPLPEPYKKGGE